MSLRDLTVLLLICCVCGKSEIVPTTTNSYDLDVPGSSPIRIIEGESLWKNGKATLKPRSRFEHRTFTTDTSNTNLKSPVNEDKEENNSVALRDFLNNYAESLNKNKPEELNIPSKHNENKEKKSWNLLELRQHNHPYEDRKGWISLDPVPWSVSKISKWQSKQKPVDRPWDSYPSEEKPWDNNNENSQWDEPVQQNNYHYDSKPQQSNDRNYQVYYANENKPNRPDFQNPSEAYGQTVHVHSSMYPNRNPIKVNNYYQHNKNCNHDENVAIITDGRPSNFPNSHYDHNRRVGTELQPETHPNLNDEGEWVLLSTTKGYKLPKARQRSLNLNPDAIGTHRTVRLTVLPPLKGSEVNMTTSHGGLLQVESTFETVDQAQKKFVKLQKIKTKTKTPLKIIKRRKPAKEITSSAITTVPRNNGPDSGTVLAAVGAGMIPATMAMLVPLAMNGRRRKRNILFATSNPSSTEINLPRYYL